MKFRVGANQVSEYGGPNGLPFPGGFSGILTVHNDGTVDTLAPTLVSLVVNPPSGLVASPPSNVTFTVKATDEGGVETAYALLASPDGQSYDLFPMTRSSGTALNGTWTGSVAVSAAYPAGTYVPAPWFNPICSSPASVRRPSRTTNPPPAEIEMVMHFEESSDPGSSMNANPAKR